MYLEEFSFFERNEPKAICFFLSLFVWFGFFLASAPALQSANVLFDHLNKSETNQRPLPRFASLKSGKINLRTGPGVHYSVSWIYLKTGLPVEIIQEYDNWRRIRDFEGVEGWVNQSLLSGKRTGIISPWYKERKENMNLFDQPDTQSQVIAFLQPGLTGAIKNCHGAWCYMVFGSYRGWVARSFIWGTYPDEEISR